MTNIDYQKEQFALEIADQVMRRCREAMNAHQSPSAVPRLKAQIDSLILDAIEFGIQLGGMDLKEGE